MNTFNLGYSTHTDWQTAVKECLELAGKDESANLGFVYLTDPFAIDSAQILQQLKDETGISHWVGSIGQAILCSQHEFYDQPAIVILLTHFNENSFSIFNNEIDTHQYHAADSLAGVRFALVHGDPRNGQIPDIIEQLPEKLGHGYLTGGLTSASEHYFQIADKILEGQLSGVVFDDTVPVVTGLTQGCSPIGPIHTLTECDNHMAITIDQRPALEVFKEDIGEILARDIDRAAGYIFAGFPVTDSDTGDYLVRNIVGIDPENDLLAIGEYMQADTPIMFCRRDANTAIEDMKRMLQDVKTRLGGATPKGGIYISCLGRGEGLFGDDSAEMQLIYDVFGNIPLAGFYANGEIAGHRLYGYTGVLTLFV